MTTRERTLQKTDWRFLLGWLVLVLAVTQVAAQALPSGVPPLAEAATGGAASAFASFWTNVVKRAWGGKDGNPPDVVPLLCAGLFGVVGTVLIMIALGIDLTAPAHAAKATIDGVLAGGGGAVMLNESYKMARPASVNLQKLEDRVGPCCTHPDCRYAALTPTRAALAQPPAPVPQGEARG